MRVVQSQTALSTYDSFDMYDLQLKKKCIREKDLMNRLQKEDFFYPYQDLTTASNRHTAQIRTAPSSMIASSFRPPKRNHGTRLDSSHSQ